MPRSARSPNAPSQVLETLETTGTCVNLGVPRPRPSESTLSFSAYALAVARCEVRYSGRLDALLPEALRLIMIKADGSGLARTHASPKEPS